MPGFRPWNPGIYMEQQLGYQNAYARDLEDEFGIGTQEDE